MYSTEFSERADALEMERRIKGWSRRKKEALIRGDWDEIRRLSRNRQDRPSTGSLRQAQGEREIDDLVYSARGERFTGLHIPLNPSRRGGWSVVVVVGVEAGIVGVAVKRATDVLAAVVGREVVVI